MLLAKLLFIIYYSSILVMVDSARILGIFPMPSFSHQVVFNKLMQELARHGHEIVVITPNPALPKDRPPDNITEIDTSESYELLAKAYEDNTTLQLKRGVVMNLDSILNDKLLQVTVDLMASPFKITEVKEFLSDKSQKFDLVIAEALGNYHLVTSYIYKAPVILISSFYGFPEHLNSMGAIAWHPIYYPSFYRQIFRNLSLWQKLQEIHTEWKIYCYYQSYEEYENKLLKQQFGPDVPTVSELRKNVQMLFLNAHPMIGNNRPVPPSVIYFSALHLQPVKLIPQGLKEILDNSTRGVIYVSLGTNVRPSLMDGDLLEAFLTAFEALPYDILWKFDGDSLPRIPNNLKIQKWFPQRDLLMHPNIKVFITQGGLQSTDETIDAAVPVVGLPMLGDQWYNVNKYVELGIGEYIDVMTMTADDLIRAVTKVIEDPRQNIKRLRDVIKDVPETPIESAVWWTEHILRHGGRHLQASSANTTWTEYYMLDILALVISAITLILVVVLYICYITYHVAKRRFTAETKLKEN